MSMKLEVKVNDGGFLIDATMEVKDGVMLVTPVKALSKEEEKEEVFNPQDGDIVAVKNGQHVFINKVYKGQRIGYAYIGWDFNTKTSFKEGLWSYSRYATEAEKDKLFRALADNGLEWDAEKREIVKLRWTPKDGDEFFMPCCLFGEETKTIFTATSFRYDSVSYKDIKEWGEYKRGWVFKTKEECQSLCDKMNVAIAAVTP